MIAFILGNLCTLKRYVRTPNHAGDDAHCASRYPIHAMSKVVSHSFQEIHCSACPHSNS